MIDNEILEYYDRCVTFGLDCEIEDFIIKIEDSKIIATKYVGEPLSVMTLPNFIDKLSSEVFSDDVKDKLSKIDLSNVSELDADVFRRSELESVKANYLLRISDTCFKDCINLKQISIPNVEYIGYMGFAGCENLVNISLSDGVILSDGVFRWCYHLGQNKLS